MSMKQGHEMLADKVARLELELKEAKGQMDSCRHEFSDPVPAQRTVLEYFFVRFEEHGSDPEPVYDSYPKTERGWSRTCAKCGYSEYTAKSKPVIARYEPDFAAGNRK